MSMSTWIFLNIFHCIFSKFWKTRSWHIIELERERERLIRILRRDAQPFWLPCCAPDAIRTLNLWISSPTHYALTTEPTRHPAAAVIQSWHDEGHCGGVSCRLSEEWVKFSQRPEMAVIGFDHWTDVGCQFLAGTDDKPKVPGWSQS